MKLPTLDQFRKQFKDAVAAGHPLDKCLDMGTVFGTEYTKFSTKDVFQKTFKDAMSAGLSVKDALRKATDTKDCACK